MPSTLPMPQPAGRTEQALIDALERLAPAAPGVPGWLEESAETSGLTAPGSPDAVVTAVHRMPAAAASYAPFPEDLDPRMRRALAARGITQLYTHQAHAIAHARAGQSVVVITPTASGKTLCYNGPVLDAILRDPSARALYLFPTKALAQDQLAELHGLCELIARPPSAERRLFDPSQDQAGQDQPGRDQRGLEALSDQSVLVQTALDQTAVDQRGLDQHGPESAGPPIGVFTYDGDTPQDARRAIRTRAHIVLSNPDMLHAGILPHHPRWAKLFENLQYVIIDELHAYRGVFGSHLANIIRRLHRVCRHYGSSPVFICTSATIANPVELAERLTDRSVALVAESGAPRAEKFFVFVNPPVVNRQLGIRRSYLAESRRVALEFLKRQLQIIVFAQSRLATEILTTYLKEDCQGPPGSPELVRGYRGGYLPLRRREIERGLRQGSVRAVVSTSALELGIDIGALDVAVMAGYPGTVAATWQRAGRAGRRAGRSAAVLVASSAPLDQFIVRNPDYFFSASPEHALINPDNLQVLLDHVKCAAFELPFGADERFGREDVQQVLGVLGEEGFVHLADGAWNWTHESYPADAVSLRSISSDNFVIVDVTRASRVIGETDFTSAPATLHEKAIYILEGQLYQVERLDFEGRKAYVASVDCEYYTDAITYSKVTVLEQFAEAGCGRASGRHGEVHVVSRVVGFKKIRFYTNENVGAGELDLPEQPMHTTSWWLTIPADVLAELSYAVDDRRDGISGMAYAMRTVAQLLLMCDRRDIGVSVDTDGSSTRGEAGAPAAAPARGPRATPIDARIFIYDNFPGGIGFSAPLHDMQAQLLDATRNLIAGCACASGCPSCVGPIGEIGPRGKRVALHLLARVTGAPDPSPSGPSPAGEIVPF